MAWTDQQIELLTVLWAAGMATSEIGRRFGVSVNSIVGKAHRLHLDRRPSPIKPRIPDADRAAHNKMKDKEAWQRKLAQRRLRRDAEHERVARLIAAAAVDPAPVAPVQPVQPVTVTLRVEDAVSEFIRRNGVTRCPAVALEPTTAVLSEADRALIALHQIAQDEAWRARNPSRTKGRHAAPRAMPAGAAL